MNAPQESFAAPDGRQFIVPSSYISTTSDCSILHRRYTEAWNNVRSLHGVPLESLLATVLPSISPKHISAIVDKLIQEKETSQNILNQDGWADFQTPPREQDGTTHVVFQAFERIFLRVLQVSKSLFPDCPPSNLVLGVHGNHIPHSDWPGGTRPGGSLHFRETCLPYKRESILVGGGNVDLIDRADICCFLEFKRHDSPANFRDNVEILFYNVHCRFRHDPRCRFVFGLTIEDTTTRFWQFSRSKISLSEKFDFNKQKELLVHIFLALARGSLQQLGFDTTVRCVGPIQSLDETTHRLRNIERTYEIDVHTNNDKHGQSVIKTFRTVRCIDNHSAAQIRGRGTRVYEVTDVDRPDASYVLKDSWVERGRSMEGELLLKIRKRLEATRPEFLPHFLDVECHGVVMLDNGPDTASSFVRQRDPASLQSQMEPCIEHDEEPDYPHYSVHGSTDNRSDGHTRMHHRVVFKGPPGVSIGELGVKEAFDALHGGLMALLGMYHVGFIHRDISCGNILLANGDTGPVGILIDLEYAKVFPDPSGKPHDHRTGTRQFMSIEVATGAFLFETERRSQPITWFHNPIHDIESIWWLAVWIFYNQPNASEQDKKEYGRLFDSSNGDRGAIFALGYHFLQTCNRPPEKIKRILDDLRRKIIEVFTDMQSGLNDGSYLSFDYKPIFQDSLRFVSQIQQVLSEPVVYMDSVQDEEAMAPSEDDNGTKEGPPTKRRKTLQGDKENDKENFGDDLEYYV